MKKLLTLTAACTLLTVPATAVQKCVALDTSTTTCTSSPVFGNADWSATCRTNGTSVPIKGIAMCSGQRTDAQYGTSDAIRTVYTSSDTNNLNCWCKMVEPVVSPWMFVSAHPSAGGCAYDCSVNCAAGAERYSAFRSALFGSISN